MRRVVERAPAFLVRLAPKRRLRVEARKIPERDADLSHGPELFAHDFTKNILERRVDDGIQKLRRAKTVSAADLAKIVEANRQGKFACLKLFATLLADQPATRAQRKCQRGLVIGFVVGQ